MCGCKAHTQMGAQCTCQCPSHASLRATAHLATRPSSAQMAGVYIPPTEPVILVDTHGQEMARAPLRSGMTSLVFNITRAGTVQALYSVHEDFLFSLSPLFVTDSDSLNVDIYQWSA